MATMTESQRAAADAARMTRASVESTGAFVTGFYDQVQRLTQLTADFWAPQFLDQEQVRTTAERINAAGRAVTSAALGVAGESLRAPYWLAGAGDPTAFQAQTFRLFDAQRDLYNAYLDAALGYQQALTEAMQRAIQTTREAIDVQVQTARQVVNDVREVQEASVDTARTVAEAGRATAEQVAAETQRATERATAQAERAQRAATQNGTQARAAQEAQQAAAQQAERVQA